MPSAANDPTVRLPAGSGASRAGLPGGAAGDVGYASTGTPAPGSPWPDQPPPRSAPGAPRGRGPGSHPPAPVFPLVPSASAPPPMGSVHSGREVSRDVGY